MLSVFNDICSGKQMDLEGKRLKEIAKAHGDGSLVDKDVKGRWCVFGPGVSGSKLSLSKKNPGADRLARCSGRVIADRARSQHDQLQ